MQSRGLRLAQIALLLSLPLVAGATGLSTASDPQPTVQEFPVCTAAVSQSAPTIEGSLVAWKDMRNGNLDVYSYNLATGAESMLAGGPGDQYSSALYNGVLAWQDRGQVWGDLHVLDLVDGRKITIPATTELQAALGDGLVLWGGADITGVDLDTLSPVRLTDDPYAQSQPRIWGNIVVWTDWRNGDADIYGYNLGSGVEFPICVEAGNQTLPAISANLVVWQDNLQGNLDVYGYDLVSSTSFAIASSQLAEDRPAVWGGTVVWQDRRGGNLDIYGARLLPAISGRVLVQGRASNRGAQVRLDGYALSTPPDGSFNFLALTPGSHALEVYLPGYLGQRLEVQAGPGSTSISDIRLKGGDVNGDGVIDVADLVQTAQAINSLVPHRGTPPDINGDGVVNVLDMALAGINLGARE